MATIKLRRGTAAQWTAANPILADGEVGVESADGVAPDKAKIGDGVTTWSALSYSIRSDWIPLAEKGIAGGVATLDVDGMVPLAQLPGQAALDAEITAAVDAEATLRSDADTAHASDTTGVHGIADTSVLSLTNHTHIDATVASNRQTDSYTLVLADADAVVEMDKATANNATLPPDTYDVNDCGEIMQYGPGQTTVVEGAGVTIRSPGGKKKIGAQYGACSWRLIASNEYHLEGNLTT